MNDSEQIIQVPARFLWVPVAVITMITVIVSLALLRERIVNPLQPQMTVTGEGKAFVRPDIGVVRLGVRTERMKSPQDAVSENSKKMNRITALLGEQGIEEKDIQTVNFNLYPDYDYDRETSKKTLAGFTVVQELHVKIRDIEKIGAVLEKATSAGANTVGQLSFDVDDPELAKAEARTEAIEKARALAEHMADAAGVHLGKLISISESGGYPPMPMPRYGMGGGVEALALDAAPTISPGQQKITVQVHLTYQLR